jgi:hypothetical protein
MRRACAGRARCVVETGANGDVAEVARCVFVILVLAGCAPPAGGSGQPANAPHQQEDPRDTGGMH